MPRPFSVIVAMDTKGGIGKNGALPWHLPHDLKHFKEITTKTKEKGRQNAVIMGRRTWESIPQNFRPLPERVNCVLTRHQDFSFPAGVAAAHSLDEALALFSQPSFAEQVENIFIIGGAELFREALAHNFCQKVYFTQILGDYSCDTFCPVVPNIFEQKSITALKKEKDIMYRFLRFERRVAFKATT